MKQGRRIVMCEAKEIAMKFLDCWRDREWYKMLEYTQISWKKLSKRPATRLKVIFGWAELKSYKMARAKKISDVCYDIKVEIRYPTIGGKYIDDTVTLRVICEIGYMKPDVEGAWGVNPQSLFRDNKRRENENPTIV